ncbi:MAG: threonine--tRNA ligase [Candidatus Moranbacteria bacterium]|jgi:threonyl-tRNA synthetase|nr:threonine--tRNA ligase [Candidatus Moranbacteria bacterium]
MSEKLPAIRHSFAHLLAAAVLRLHPDALPTIGPAIEDGFYYDFDFTTPIGDENLKRIEKEMRNILKTWKSFDSREVTAEEARQIFAANPYKLELISDIIGKGEPITLYRSGDFEDLCRGGHTETISLMRPDAFKLTRIAGAYWRGNDEQKMLTRIYGYAFEDKEALDIHVARIEEAKKRDHKKLGVDLDLFTFSDLVGSGLPLWTPKGTLLRTMLDQYVWELRSKAGYERVEIPHITKKDLYITSGHWDKFKDELFRITTREGHEFAMKPMNCPHHTQIYARKQWSYRELPQRYANTTMCYRDEQSGELSGLARVRSLTQDDAHVFCRMSQAKEEFIKIWDIVQTFYKSFGFDLRVRISRHDPSVPDSYLGTEEQWKLAETILEDIAKEKNADAFDGIGEAAFYGPKLDFMTRDALGREWQVATIQLDMSMPERFNLSCINEKGEHERIVMIHAAIMGSIERFLSMLIENIAGNFPLWLAPEQVRILPIGEGHQAYAETLADTLRDASIRVSTDASSESLGKRIRSAKLQKIPYLIVVGDKEVETSTLSLESRDRGQIGSIDADALISQLHTEIADKRFSEQS